MHLRCACPLQPVLGSDADLGVLWSSGLVSAVVLGLGCSSAGLDQLLAAFRHFHMSHVAESMLFVAGNLSKELESNTLYI